MHHLDSNEMLQEKARWKLQEDVKWYFEQILKTAPFQNNNYMAIYLPSYKPCKKLEQNMLETAKEVRMNLCVTFSHGLPQLDTPVLVD